MAENGKTEEKQEKKDDRWGAGVIPYAKMGYWNPDYEPKETEHPGGLPDHAAEGRRPDRGVRRRRR